MTRPAPGRGRSPGLVAALPPARALPAILGRYSFTPSSDAGDSHAASVEYESRHGSSTKQAVGVGLDF